MPKKRRKRSERQKLWDRAWKLFSIFVRKKGSDFGGYNKCYTCYKVFHWSDMNAGHYRHDAFDFDERNVKPQCVHCNLGESGRSDNFYLHLVEEYGKTEAEYLRNRAKWNDYTIEQLQEIIQKYLENPVS